jgi:hypothetical protein
MHKKQIFAVVLALALAIPFAALALLATAYFTDYTSNVAGTVTGVTNWREVALQGAARWPELAGMIVGQLLILSILLIARHKQRDGDESLFDGPDREQSIVKRQVPGRKPSAWGSIFIRGVSPRKVAHLLAKMRLKLLDGQR